MNNNCCATDGCVEKRRFEFSHQTSTDRRW